MNTRPHRKTMARARREQLGVQLRVEPDSLAYLTALGERACKGCGYHECACAKTVAVKQPWEGATTDRIRDCIREAFKREMRSYDYKIESAFIPSSFTTPYFTVDYVPPPAYGLTRYPEPAPNPAPEPVAVGRVEVGDTWRHRDGHEHRVISISGSYADLCGECHCISLTEHGTPALADLWSLVSRARPASTDWRSCATGEDALRMFGFHDDHGSWLAPGADHGHAAAVWRGDSGWWGQPADRRMANGGNGEGTSFGSDWRAAIAHALGTAQAGEVPAGWEALGQSVYRRGSMTVWKAGLLGQWFSNQPGQWATARAACEAVDAARGW